MSVKLAEISSRTDDGTPVVDRVDRTPLGNPVVPDV